MREASMKDITKFFECKRLALVGVSRKSLHFSRAVMKEFLAAGYDVVPVNPQATDIDGHKCFARLAEIDPPVEAALLLTGSPQETNKTMRECREAGIRNIWIYKNVHDGAEHEKARELYRSQSSALIEGYCPLMFLPGTNFFHRAHGFLVKLVGHYPL